MIKQRSQIGADEVRRSDPIMARGSVVNRDTVSVSFQHMVNLVLNHRPCQVKSIQYHSTPFFKTFSLSQIQSGPARCCCAETCLTAHFQEFHVFKPKSKGWILLFCLGNTLETSLLGHFEPSFKYLYFKYIFGSSWKGFCFCQGSVKVWQQQWFRQVVHCL